MSAVVSALKQYKFNFGVKFNDAKKMKELIDANVINGFSITLSNTTNGFDNYEITVDSKTKEIAIQKIVIFLSEQDFGTKTIETFKTKASQPKIEKPKIENVSSSSTDVEPSNTATKTIKSKASQPKIEKPKIENVSSSSTDVEVSNSATTQVSGNKPKVVKPHKSNSSSSEDIVSDIKFELSFGVFTTSKDKSAIDLNLDKLNFTHVSTTGKFDNYKTIVNASSKVKAIELVVSNLEKIGVSAKTIENFKEKSSK
jgi:hypothetical protein